MLREIELACLRVADVEIDSNTRTVTLSVPFSKTDYVEVKGMEGEVTAIDLRYTTLQHDGQKILLPNSLLFTNPITIGKPSEG